MWLQLRSSDNETDTHVLLELIASAIKNAMKRRLLELSNNHHYYEKSQSSCKNDDENEASETI